MTVTDLDRTNGYDVAAIGARVGTEFATGVLSGALSKGGGNVGKGIGLLHLGENLSQTAQGTYGIVTGSWSTENAVKVLGGAAGLGGNLGGVSRLGLSAPRSAGSQGPIAVTEEAIRRTMRDAPLVSQQSGGVSLPVIERYVRLLEAGKVPPPIKVDGNIIVDGNHRYIAGRLFGKEPPIQPYVGGRPNSIVPWQVIPIDPENWP